jgi:hypothetical protein
VSVEAPGRLSAVLVGTVGNGVKTLPDALVQTEAAPVKVGATGGSFSGPGWPG